MRITNQQKGNLADIIHENQMYLSEFEVSGKQANFNIKYKFDYFSFKIYKLNIEEYRLTLLSIHTMTPGSLVRDWDNLLKIFRNWVRDIKQEINATISWNYLLDGNYLNTNYQDLDEHFSDEEKHAMKIGLYEIRENLKALNLTIDTLRAIEQKLTDLELKLDELKKFDWKSLFIGTIASLIMSLGIPAESAGALWGIIKTVFNDLRLKV